LAPTQNGTALQLATRSTPGQSVPERGIAVIEKVRFGSQAYLSSPYDVRLNLKSRRAVRHL
jgi:hypothetical protein